MGGGIEGAAPLSRRDLLAAGGVAAAGLVAGCSGGGGEAFVTVEENSPENVNYNRFDDTYFPGQSAELIFGSFYRSTAGQDTEGDGVLPGLMKVEAGPWENVSGTPELVIEDDEFVLPMFEDRTWHDGDPVTARDVVTLMELERLRDANMWEPLESVEVVDDYAVRIETVPDVLEPLVIDRVITTNMSVKHDVFAQFLPEKPIEDMETQERRNAVRELVQFQYNEPDQVVGWGPWELSERGSTELTLTLVEDHPRADEFDFETIRSQWFSASEALQQHFITGEIDGLHETPTSIVGGEIPEAYEPYPYDTRVGMGLAFNYDHEWFSQRAIRQAFAFALDRGRMVENSGYDTEWVEAHEFDTGFLVGRDLHEEYFGADFLDELTTYGTDRDRAATLLEGAGWSREDGTWYDSNDEAATLEIKISQTPGPWSNMVENAAQQLSAFGIDTTPTAQNVQIYYGVTMPTPTYEMAGWIVGEGRPMPYIPLLTLWEGSEAVDVTHNHPDEVEVPWPPGDPEGDLQTVNYTEKLSELARTPLAESQERFQELVWTYNQWLPVYSINRTRSAGWLYTEDWTGPDPARDDASTFQPLTRLLNRGLIEPTG
jgi:peptide/nickel transport system substrate-binding protein